MNGANSDRVMHEPNGQTNTPTTHSITSQDRRAITVRGVREVISFDESSVLLATTSGHMNIEGTGLRVNILDVKEGTVSVDGHIDSIYYSDNESEDRSHGFFGRLFH